MRAPPPQSRRKSTNRSAELERARAAYAASAWGDAFEAFTRADRVAALGAEDLERLAWSAALTGRDEIHHATLERLHDLYEQAGELLLAARAAFWLGFRLFSLGEVGRATGWTSRAARLVDRHGGETVLRGYLCLPRAFGLVFGSQDPAAAIPVARQAAEIGERFEDSDLTSLARMIEGQAHVAVGQFPAGLALMDEAMLSATTGTLSPAVTGIVYCAVISSCERVYAIDRAREWTNALAAWRDRQPQLVAFNGPCRVHRAQILQLQGAWPEAIVEARLAADLLAQTLPRHAVAGAHYQEGEILRLRGEFESAEEAYRRASGHGREPQPGLALLRLAQGRCEAAVAAIRNAVAATPDPLARSRYLPAAVEIFLAAGDGAAAEDAATDLERIAAETGNEVLDAMAAHARGSIRLSQGEAARALEPLRRAFALWQKIGAPYLAARLRVLIAEALTALGDREGAGLERDAARAVFRELAAAPDLARLDPGAPKAGKSAPFGLTPREIEVLRLLATGRTNRAISEELFLSGKTVDRHVSNLFAKLGVSTRAAATAFAYQHQLV